MEPSTSSTSLPPEVAQRLADAGEEAELRRLAIVRPHE